MRILKERTQIKKNNVHLPLHKILEKSNSSDRSDELGCDEEGQERGRTEKDAWADGWVHYVNYGRDFMGMCPDLTSCVL